MGLKIFSVFTGKSVEPTCNTTVWNSFSSELGMSWSLEAESLIFKTPIMRLVCWMPKSSSPGITKPRQFEDPTNKHFTLVLPSVFSFEWRVSGESIQGGPNSCTSSSWGTCSGSRIASGLGRLGKLSALGATAAGLGQSRAIWPVCWQLKHCYRFLSWLAVMCEIHGTRASGHHKTRRRSRRVLWRPEARGPCISHITASHD